jgi:hypothetical protein
LTADEESAKKSFDRSFSHHLDKESGLFVSHISFLTLSILQIIPLFDSSKILFQKLGTTSNG